MSAYVIVEITVRDHDRYEEYKEMASRTVHQFGGRYVVRGGTTETLEGSWSPNRLVVLEFPTVDQARSWWASEAYAPAKALRQQLASTEMVLVQGV
jgi:uncharacterized protein (DUF1330 family)